MSMWKKATTILFIILMATGVYLYYSFTFFTPPKITLFSPKSIHYQRLKQNETTLCYHADTPTQPIIQSELQLLVWNIHKGMDSGWQAQLEQFSQQADILLLQEVSSHQALNTLMVQSFPYFLYTASFSYHNAFSGIGTLSHFAPQTYCGSTTKEPWIQIPKTGSATTYSLANGQSLLVVNLHLVNFEWNPTNYRQQLSQAFELIAAHQGPIILAGDFNTWNSERLTLVRELADTQGFKQVVFQPDVRLHFFNNPLDHIFVKGLSIVSATTQATSSSDHNPLFVKLKLEQP